MDKQKSYYGIQHKCKVFCSLVFYSIYWASEYKNHYLKGILPSLKIHPTPPKHMKTFYFILILSLSFYHVKLAGILHCRQCHSDFFLWQSFYLNSEGKKLNHCGQQSDDLPDRPAFFGLDSPRGFCTCLGWPGKFTWAALSELVNITQNAAYTQDISDLFNFASTAHQGKGPWTWIMMDSQHHSDINSQICHAKIKGKNNPQKMLSFVHFSFLSKRTTAALQLTKNKQHSSGPLCMKNKTAPLVVLIFQKVKILKTLHGPWSSGIAEPLMTDQPCLQTTFTETIPFVFPYIYNWTSQAHPGLLSPVLLYF